MERVSDGFLGALLDCFLLKRSERINLKNRAKPFERAMRQLDASKMQENA